MHIIPFLSFLTVLLNSWCINTTFWIGVQVTLTYPYWQIAFASGQQKPLLHCPLKPALLHQYADVKGHCWPSIKPPREAYDHDVLNTLYYIMCQTNKNTSILGSLANSVGKWMMLMVDVTVSTVFEKWGWSGIRPFFLVQCKKGKDQFDINIAHCV